MLVNPNPSCLVCAPVLQAAFHPPAAAQAVPDKVACSSLLPIPQLAEAAVQCSAVHCSRRLQDVPLLRMHPSAAHSSRKLIMRPAKRTWVEISTQRR